MLDPSLLRNEADALWKHLARRNYRADTKAFADLTERLGVLRQQDQSLREQRNEIAAQIGTAGKDADPHLRKRGGAVGAELKNLAGQLAEAEEAWRQFCLDLPNVPDEDVPQGNTEADNRVLAVYDGTGREQPKDWHPAEHADPRPHEDIGQRLGMYEPERAAAMSGARFAVLTGPLARLHRALGQFFIDLQLGRGYREAWVPWLLQPQALEGTGHMHLAADMFPAGDAHYLLPTGEAPLVNLFAGRILADDEVPAKVTALTPCFRSEAGSYGRDTRGLIRQHQFEKVELVCLSTAADSPAALAALVADAQEPLRQLGLPYRVVALCTGDLAFTAAKTLDIEAWMPGQRQWRELSSCSNCRDFQTRRLQIRRRVSGGDVSKGEDIPKNARAGKQKTELLHSLNGSALAVGRSLAALLENCWDGEKVRIPEVLQPYMAGAKTLPQKPESNL